MTRTFTYRLIEIEEWTSGKPVYDDEPGSFRHTDAIEHHRNEWVIATWHDEDEYFGLYMLLEGNLIRLAYSEESNYELQRRASEKDYWEYVTTPWRKPNVSELPEGYTNFENWLRDYIRKRN